MRRIAIIVLCLAIPLPAIAQMAVGATKHDNRIVLSFNKMFGVDDPFVAAAGMIRGIPGDEAPWEIKSARGSLSASGHLVINVRGLVFKNDLRSPPDEIGKNDETQFRALVSCLSTDATTPVNVETVGFPANSKGNANINTRLTLPNPCIAPIVMILAGSEEKWFAMTGTEDSSD
jgi:hypothetical protein